MFCTQCGSKNPEDARFCHKCGQSVWQPQELMPTPTKPIVLNEIARTSISTSSSGHVRGKQNEALNGVKGWLLFLCISLTILSPLYTLGQLGVEWRDTEPLFGAFPSLKDAVVFESLCMVGLMAFSIYAGSVLWSVKPGAVKVAKNYFLVLLLYSLVFPFVLSAIADLPSVADNEIAKEGVKNAIRGILAFAIWFTYLNKSRRVRATYPTPETHVRCPDCRKLVPKETRLCEYCGCKLIPQP